jgi:hypothetical protein
MRPAQVLACRDGVRELAELLLDLGQAPGETAALLLEGTDQLGQARHECGIGCDAGRDHASLEQQWRCRGPRQSSHTVARPGRARC